MGVSLFISKMQHTLYVSVFAGLSKSTCNRLANIMKCDNGEKTVVTTDFCHSNKKYYSQKEIEKSGYNCLHVPSYGRNLSLARIWSHLVFAWRLRKFLNNLPTIPDRVYCAMPTSSAAFICAKYCHRKSIPFIIDVIDLWPDSLIPLTRTKKLLKVLVKPWSYMTRFAYHSADIIIAESREYGSVASRFNNKAIMYPIYLGVDVSYVKLILASNPIKLYKPKDEVWIGYAGNLGQSYDFDTLIDAVKALNGRYRYKLWFIGDGEMHEYINSSIQKNLICAEITGYIPYKKLLGYLAYCDIAINIFKADTKVVHSYKFNDYAAMGCFILNSLEGETAEMIERYKVGLNFNFTDYPLKKILNETLAHWDTYQSWRQNNQLLIQQKLDQDKIYQCLEKIL